MASERTTDTHVYFWGGVFSNFFQKKPLTCPLFRQAIWRDGPLLEFNSSEQYLMACKAMMFGNVLGFRDHEIWNPSVFEMIMRETTPKAQKSLGRKVTGFIKDQWDDQARQIMTRGLYAKFTQNTDLMHRLLDTEQLILVEGSPYDQIWGVGLAWDDPLIDNHKNWRGMNWLGECLMQARDLVRLSQIGEDVSPYLF